MAGTSRTRSLNTEVNLIILGLLKKKEMSAYDMITFIEKRGLDLVYKISEPSIYKNLVALAEGGYLHERIEQHSNFHPKTIYKINKSGEQLFKDTFTALSQKSFEIYFSFDPLLAFADLMDKKSKHELILSIETQLKNKLAALESLAEKKPIELDGRPLPQPAMQIIKRYQNLYGYLLMSLQQF